METENREFYIKYNDNQPVLIETQYNTNGQKRDRALTSVGHLVAAYKTAVAPRFDATPTDELTIHSVTDGVEATYDTWDFLTALGENGRTGTNPLIIRSQGMLYLNHRYRSAGKSAKLFQYANF